MNKRVAIIGGGIAGIEAANVLTENNIDTVLVERENKIGGHVAQWDRLFPTQRHAAEVTESLESRLRNTQVITNQQVKKVEEKGDSFILTLSNNDTLSVNAVLIASGFKLFRAQRKEEYGYGIYDNVYTSADLEKMFAQGKVQTKDGREPQKIGFVHCVGSRDEKVHNRHCSKVCCATAVKQAMEIKQLFPNADVYCFYMDLRMFDRYYENMYLEAQTKYRVQFIRGRVSEASEDVNNHIVVKAEDTLTGKPIKVALDMLVLMAGMEASENTADTAQSFNITAGDDGFLSPKDEYLACNLTQRKGVFLAGTCTGPKTIPETLADARAAAAAVQEYLIQQKG